MSESFSMIMLLHSSVLFIRHIHQCLNMAMAKMELIAMFLFYQHEVWVILRSSSNILG